MVRLGILHATLPGYMASTNQEELRHLEVCYSASDPAQFLREVPDHRPQVLVLDLALLGDRPVETVNRMEQQVQPEMTLIVYAFAKWDTVEALRADGRHIMRAPVSVRALRSNLISLIVKQLAAPQSGNSANNTEKTAMTTPAALLASKAPDRRYDSMQLAGLQEIQSTVDCECPNQVADLVLALGAFEDYSAQCENRNAADAEVHAMLYRASGHARAIMEEALARVCAHEKIDIYQLPDRIRGAGQAER